MNNLSIPNQLAPFASIVPAWVLLLSTLVVALVLLFAGRTVVKVVAFLVVGVVGASIGGMLAAEFLTGAGALGTLLGIILGFLVGGLAGVVLIALGIGLAIGYAAYILTATLVQGSLIPLAVGFVLFIVGLAFYDRVVSIVTSLAGGLLLFDVLLMYGMGPAFSTVAAVGATIAGIMVQEGLTRRQATQAVQSPGGQPSDHR